MLVFFSAKQVTTSMEVERSRSDASKEVLVEGELSFEEKRMADHAARMGNVFKMFKITFPSCEKSFQTGASSFAPRGEFTSNPNKTMVIIQQSSFFLRILNFGAN